MRPAEIDAMRADMQTGTPGPWGMETKRTSCGVCHQIGPWSHQWRHGVTMSACIYDDYPSPPKGTDMMLANARRIARVPAMEAEILRLRATLDVYEEALTEAEAIFGGEYGDHYGPMCKMAFAARDARAALNGDVE